MEEEQRQLTVAEQRALAARLQQAVAVHHLPQEDPVPPLYSGWTSHLSHRHINDLAASDNELWAVTWGGVVRWRCEGEAVVYTRYASEHGLPGSRFDCIALDRQGRPWVGGRAVGLSYLDGTRWCTLTAEHGLPSPDVLCLMVAPDGDLWVGTANGIGRVSLKAGTPHWQPHDLANADLPADEVRALAIGPSDTLWLGTSWGLYRHEPAESSWRRYTMADDLVDNEVSHLLLDPDGRLWIGTAQGLCAFDGEKFVSFPQISSAVWSMAAESETDALWIVAAGEAWRYAGEEWSHIAVSPSWREKAQGRAVATNERGGVWVGFDSGLVQLVPEHRVLSMPVDSEMLESGISAMAIDDRRRVWAGTSSGLWVFEENAWRRLRIGNELGSPLSGTENIAVSPTGEVWVGSWVEGKTGGLRCFEHGVEASVARANSPKCVDAMVFSPDGHLWVAAKGLIWTFDGNEWSQVVECSEQGALVQALLVDATGRLWCGSTARLDCYEDGNWKQRISGEEVNALAEDATGKLWIGTSRGLRYVEGEVVQSFEGALPAEVILVLAVSKDGDLWIGTSDGLARLRGGELFTWRAEDSGLTDGHVRALAVDDDSTVWIGTANGISRFTTSNS
jgi:ligand-binding sensor domain-containing protein